MSAVHHIYLTAPILTAAKVIARLDRLVGLLSLYMHDREVDLLTEVFGLR